MSDKKYKVGDKLWCMDRSGGREVTINKVGRKWLYFDWNNRADIDSLVVDNGGYGASDQCYESEAEYLAELALSNAWRELGQQINRAYQLPPHITTAAIHEAAKLLGIELGEEQGK